MPCDAGHCEASAREVESRVVREFLREIAGKKFDHDDPSKNQGYYGKVDELDNDTAALCAWCMSHDVSKMSLELQLWWKKHQKADAKKLAERRRLEEDEVLKKAALAKLTKEERRVLGLRD